MDSCVFNYFFRFFFFFFRQTNADCLLTLTVLPLKNSKIKSLANSVLFQEYQVSFFVTPASFSCVRRTFLFKSMKLNVSTQMSPPPEYISSRVSMFDELKAAYAAEVAAKPVQTIVVTLPDGRNVEAESWRSTPYDIARGIR